MRRLRSLQNRLVVSTVLLLTVVFLVVGVGAALSLRGYLYRQLDDQVSEIARFRSNPPQGDPDRRPPPPDAGGGFVGGGPDRPANTLEVTVDDGRIVRAVLLGRPGTSRPVPPEQVAPAIATTPGQPPHTLDIAGLGSFRFAAATGDDGTVTVVGLSTAALEDTVGELVVREAVIFGIGVVLAAVAAAFTTRLTLRPLHRVSATARRVSELPLSSGEVELAERVPDVDADPRSEVGQVGAALNRMLGHVGAALAARQDSETRLRRFVADASHELRTPLAAIRGYNELAARRADELPPEVAGLLDRMGSQTQRMTALVEDLLLLARLDAGRPLAREPVDLTRLVVDAVTDAHVAAPEHRWSLDLPGEEPVEVVGDPERLHQVVANLLANARTHTPPGTLVTVGLRTVDGDGVVRLDVVDDGPGIPSDLLPHVAERFARGDTGRARTTGSTGLGLSIVSAVVAEHGGRLAIASERGETRFTVDLPAAPDGVLSSGP
ncbi:two-component system OmpR family sensor kinase [Actinomycetospora succinea]|uniref:histidine kinase n=1 Tax=Actinomycetospora succinea TaxID=663603 RepID=A0A4R6VM05_9PSEU|nr:HAMP domain-containing sensor histidine kinase [Actinomycetospora succinea]TDQ62962.1 two-component system OmpR family sensor kinase [Actinomycetospora succinea]